MTPRRDPATPGITSGLVAAALVLMPSLPRGVASAQERFRPSVTVLASTLGLGAEVSLHSRTVGVRVGYYRFGLDVTREIEGIRYLVRPHLRHARASLDVYLLPGWLRVSGGFVLSGAYADGQAELTGPITIGNRIYQPSEVGRVLGELNYERDLMPFLGAGLTTGGRVGFVLDLGVVFSGRPRFALAGETNLTGPERDEFEQNIQREEAEVRQAIRNESLARFYPVAGLGIRLRF